MRLRYFIFGSSIAAAPGASTASPGGPLRPSSSPTTRTAAGTCGRRPSASSAPIRLRIGGYSPAVTNWIRPSSSPSSSKPALWATSSSDIAANCSFDRPMSMRVYPASGTGGRGGRPAARALMESACLLGDGGPQDDAGVVDRQVRLGRGDHTAIEVHERLRHLDSSPLLVGQAVLSHDIKFCREMRHPVLPRRGDRSTPCFAVCGGSAWRCARG